MTTEDPPPLASHSDSPAAQTTTPPTPTIDVSTVPEPVASSYVPAAMAPPEHSPVITASTSIPPTATAAVFDDDAMIELSRNDTDIHHDDTSHDDTHIHRSIMSATSTNDGYQCTTTTTTTTSTSTSTTTSPQPVDGDRPAIVDATASTTAAAEETPTGPDEIALQQDYEFFSCPTQVSHGTMVYCKPSILSRWIGDQTQHGSVIFWLGELPRERCFVTERGTFIERTEEDEITLSREIPRWGYLTRTISKTIKVPRITEAHLADPVAARR